VRVDIEFLFQFREQLSARLRGALGRRFKLLKDATNFLMVFL
jgi:hypothetical protein